MITIYTLAELESALKRREKKILVCGAAATAIRAKAQKRKRIKKVAGAGLIATIGGLTLAPLTGGTSLIPAAYGLTASAGAFVLTIPPVELAILVALLKDRRVKFNPDGSVLID